MPSILKGRSRCYPSVPVREKHARVGNNERKKGERIKKRNRWRSFLEVVSFHGQVTEITIRERSRHGRADRRTQQARSRVCPTRSPRDGRLTGFDISSGLTCPATTIRKRIKRRKGRGVRPIGRARVKRLSPSFGPKMLGLRRTVHPVTARRRCRHCLVAACEYGGGGRVRERIRDTGMRRRRSCRRRQKQRVGHKGMC
ncbi:hypothetical protein LZ32DRAFT_286292 [Colletotrichum eremochloae]|nr:hypothetical protein LZ32DRAFT_286292 [Colletotrichum eremochloae]